MILKAIHVLKCKLVVGISGGIFLRLMPNVLGAISIDKSN